jgi:hypothetical protein
MAIESHSKQQIALTQLETGLRLFQEASDYYSVVTLAGAADEILGRLLESRGGVTALVSLARASAAIHLKVHGVPSEEKVFIQRANLARNSLKHHDGRDEDPVRLDIREEAGDMLDRAISNYWALTHSMTPAMEAFELSRRAT